MGLLLEEFLGSRLALLVTSRRVWEEKLGYNSHEQNFLSNSEEFWSFITPGLKGINLVCF